MRANRASAMCDSRARFWKVKRKRIEMIRCSRFISYSGPEPCTSQRTRTALLYSFVTPEARSECERRDNVLLQQTRRCHAARYPLHQKHGEGVAREHPNIFHFKLSIQHLADFPPVKLQNNISDEFDIVEFKSKIGMCAMEAGTSMTLISCVK